jgi:hypothetical protein
MTDMTLAHRDVTRYLQLLLRKEGHVFRTSAETEIVRTIKVPLPLIPAVARVAQCP